MSGMDLKTGNLDFDLKGQIGLPNMQNIQDQICHESSNVCLFVFLLPENNCNHYYHFKVLLNCL